MKISDEQVCALADKYSSNGWRSGVEITYVDFVRAARELIALAQEVEPLVWTDKLDSSVAKTPFGQYYIDYVNSHYFVGFNEDDIAATNTLEEAKEAANEHNRKRVLSQLKYGSGE
ncbi:MAG: hypothetical protein E6Q97_22495 [Desulfurellales bacterium]|nr:MAG: hypothetical protein E6Q97_22495 [Desulfurellales bacterium]